MPASTSPALPEGPVLVIDTASNRGLVGLVEGDTLLAEHSWPLATTYSQELLTQIDALLEGARVPREALTGIVVDVGPGGYGSLRVGVATAQGLALGLDVPLAAVGRLEADAAPHLEDSTTGSVVAVHDAGASGVAWAVYEAGAGAATEISAARLGTVEECAAAAPAGATWCGDLGDALRDALVEARVRWTETPPERNMRRALDFVRLARLHQAFGDPAAVDVVYLRPPSITRPRG